MDVLHYSFSLSACPKCHLLVCKHTSLANLDFRAIEQEEDEEEDEDAKPPTSINIKTRYQRLSSHGMNFYILPSTTANNNRYSWTTFGTGSIESINTIGNLSIDNETLCDNIPFANENIIHSISPLKSSPLNQIVRTQSERYQKNLKPHICLTKSYSFSTIYTTPKSHKSLRSSPHLQSIKTPSNKISSNISILILIILIITYLLTNTLDIVLLYIYYHTNSLYFILLISIILSSEIILWINNLINRKTLSTRLLFIPFILRLYMLYELVELMIIIFNKNFLDNTQIYHSSTPSSSTTTTLETNISQTTDTSLIHDDHHDQPKFYKIMKRRIFNSLTLFYLIHSSLLVFVNIYFWSNNFQLSTKSTLNMNYFIPQWTIDNDLKLSSTMNIIPIRSSIAYWPKLDIDRKHIARRTLSLNWTRPIFYHDIPLNLRLPSSSSFIITSIFYHLIINYCFLSIFLIIKRFSFRIILSILSHFCLIITRIYTFIFLIHLNAYWFILTFLFVHLSLMISLLIDRTKSQDNQKGIYLKLIFSFLTHNSINDISINALISLENISIFLHRLYLETFSSQNETTLRLIIFISILISFQIIGFLFDILPKNILYRTQTTNQTITKL